MTDNEELYSKRAEKIIKDIEEVVNIRIPIISSSEKMDISDFLTTYKDDEAARNFIQKYAETEMNNYSSKLGKFSMVLALIALLISYLSLVITPQNQGIQLFIYLDIIILVYLILWLFYIPFEKNLLKTIIMKIQDYELNKKNEEITSATTESEALEKDLKIKVEKFDLNLSISAHR